MITKEEFLTLYQKSINGNCTPGEMDMLNNYRDEMKLLGDEWEDDLVSQEEVGNHIWQRLGESRNVGTQSKIRHAGFIWFKVAATVLVTLSIGLLVIKYNKKAVPTSQLVKTQLKDILPGGK